LEATSFFRWRSSFQNQNPRQEHQSQSERGVPEEVGVEPFEDEEPQEVHQEDEADSVAELAVAAEGSQEEAAADPEAEGALEVDSLVDVVDCLTSLWSSCRYRRSDSCVSL
jgi:hypothetical protein